MSPLIYAFFSVAILAIGNTPPNENTSSEADLIYRCDFGESVDHDFNDWPDGWTRNTGPSYPQFVPVRLDFDADDDTHGMLRIDLNGGAVELFSPFIAIDDLHSYTAEASLKTADLVKDRACIRLLFFSSEKRFLASWNSAAIGGTTDWTTVSVESSKFGSFPGAYAVIGLCVDQLDPPDLRGAVWFKEARLIKSPRLNVTATTPLSIFASAEQCKVRVSVTGAREATEEIELALYDCTSHLQATVNQKLDWKPVAALSQPAQAQPADMDYQTEFEWQPPIAQCGFYRVQASLRNAQGKVLTAELPISIAPAITFANSPFGLSLCNCSTQIGDPLLLELIEQSGVGWLKIPLWTDAQGGIAPQIVKLVNTMSRHEMNCVGVLAEPPREIFPDKSNRANLSGAELFFEKTEQIALSVAATFLRFGMDIRYWQLGGEGDRSFVGYPDLMHRLSTSIKRLETPGAALRFGIGWDWTEAFPDESNVPVRFLMMSAKPPLTAAELTNYLRGEKNEHLACCVQIEPESLAADTSDERAALLALQMVASASAGAEATFFTAPIDDDHGLIDSQGRATQLFLPWRTISEALSRTTYFGQLQLPGGSPNRVFIGGDRCVMIVWSKEPIEESFYLGEKISACDLYGAKVPLILREGLHAIAVDFRPRLIFGIDQAIARWRFATSLETNHIPSVPGKACQQTVRFVNTFSQTASGTAKVNAPSGWIVTPSEFNFRLDAGATLDQQLSIILPFGAESGPQSFAIDFDVTADRAYQFETCLPLEVGLGDVTIAIATQLDENGILEIEGQLKNQSERPVRFACSLFAKNRRRQQFEIASPARGQTVATFLVENGTELLGETIWLRAAEIGTDRVLNYRFVAKP